MYFCIGLRVKCCKGQYLSELNRALGTRPWLLEIDVQCEERESVGMIHSDTLLFLAETRKCAASNIAMGRACLRAEGEMRVGRRLALDIKGWTEREMLRMLLTYIFCQEVKN